MKRWTVRWALGAGCVLLCAAAANGDEVSGGKVSDGELAELRALVVELRQQVDAQTEQIEAQGNAIDEAQERDASMGSRDAA